MSKDWPPDESSGLASESLVSGRRAFNTRDGEQLFGHKYEVGGVLGQGAMGIVMRARDKNLDRPVALKLMRPELMEQTLIYDAFMREARAMAQVRHPNVVEIYDLDQSEGTVYFAMEYLEGTDLESWLLKQERPLAADLALSVLEPLCRGVAAIHASGAVHRDLKPANVMIGPTFRVAVADFGLSVFWDDPALDQRLSGGTPEYMAPEVASGEPIVPELVARIDVYALGCMAYELLVGRLPFVSDDVGELLVQHMNDAVPQPSELNPSLAPEFEAPLLHALQKDPAARTESVEAFVAELFAAREAAAERLNWDARAYDLLIVDDDPEMLDWMELQLSLNFPDADIRRAENGMVAMERMDERIPDLVITDLDMPGVDGVELTRHLRSLPGGEATPLIVVTAVGGAVDWARLTEVGASGFQIKPIDPEALCALIRRYLPSGPATQAESPAPPPGSAAPSA